MSGLHLSALISQQMAVHTEFDKSVLPEVACTWCTALFRVSVVFLWRCWTWDFVILAYFPFGTTLCSTLLKLLQLNGQDCKYTGRRSFFLYPAQKKINLFFSFDLTNQSSPGKDSSICSFSSLCFAHHITVFNKLLCLPKRAVSGLIL